MQRRQRFIERRPIRQNLAGLTGAAVAARVFGDGHDGENPYDAAGSAAGELPDRWSTRNFFTHARGLIAERHVMLKRNAANDSTIRRRVVGMRAGFYEVEMKISRAATIRKSGRSTPCS